MTEKGPVSLDEFMWENMPTMVFKKIFSFLDNDSKKDVRAVCSIWKEEMDTEAGLNVKVDSRIRGNIPFICSVKIIQARINFLKDTDRNFLLDPSSLKTILCTGAISPQWFTGQLPRCRNLTRLVLCGRFLHSQNLQEVANGTASTMTPFRFPALKVFEIIANDMSYPEPMPLSIRRRDPSRAAAYEEFRIETSLTVVKNISYLLENVQALKLRTLHMYVRQQKGWLIPNEINWRFGPLEKFLQLHRSSLRQLFLPDFEGKYTLLHEPNRMYPLKINTLDIMLSHSMGIREENRIQSSEYWKCLLSSQTRLKNLKLYFSCFPNENILFNPILEAIGLNCNAVLRFVSILIESITDFQIDGALFQFCDCLEVLTIFSKQNEATFINFSMLPSSLKKISIGNCLILNPDSRSISQFYQLEMLQLHTLCLDPGIHELSLEVVKAFLLLRSLCYIGLNFSEDAGNNPAFGSILENFRSFWDARFHSTGLRVNFEYEEDHGWEESIFDDEENGRQDIYYFVPETTGRSFEPWYIFSNYWIRHPNGSTGSSSISEDSTHSSNSLQRSLSSTDYDGDADSSDSVIGTHFDNSDDNFF